MQVDFINNLKKIREMGVGFALNRKEPAMRAKMKRLEKLYWEIDEFIVSHPGMRPAAIKKAFCGEKSSSGVSILAQTLIEYADSGKVGKSTAAILKRTAVKVQEFDPQAGFVFIRLNPLQHPSSFFFILSIVFSLNNEKKKKKTADKGIPFPRLQDKGRTQTDKKHDGCTGKRV